MIYLNLTGQKIMSLLSPCKPNELWHKKLSSTLYFKIYIWHALCCSLVHIYLRHLFARVNIKQKKFKELYISCYARLLLHLHICCLLFIQRHSSITISVLRIPSGPAYMMYIVYNIDRAGLQKIHCFENIL